MPIQRCISSGKSGYKWGASGKCYTGPGARKRARKQELAIRATGWTENAHLSPLRADPTRTLTLRRRFVREVNRRLRRFARALKGLIVEENAFGLGLTVSENYLQVALNQRFAFLSEVRKAEEFERWLSTQIERDLLTPGPDGWWQTYVEEGYRQGAGRAFDETRKAQRALAGSQEQMGFYQGTKEEFLRSSFAQPESIAKVKTLASRTFMDLKGATEAMALELRRGLADGLARGQNPRTVARNMMERGIDGIGKRRMEAIARTEIIRAHGEGQLDSMERLRVEEVGVMAEWSTAGDDRVCPLCEPLEGMVLKIKEARGIIPRHTQCRCTYIPANVGEPKGEKKLVRFGGEAQYVGQKRTKDEIQSALERSLRAEIPKGRSIKGQGLRFKDPETGRFTQKIGRTLEEQRRMSRWAGADLNVSKVRPKSALEPKVAKPNPSGSL